MHANNQETTVATGAMQSEDATSDDVNGRDVVEVVDEGELDDDDDATFWSLPLARNNEGSVRSMLTVRRVKGN